MVNVGGLNLLIDLKKRKVSLPATFQGYPFALGESHVTVPLYGAGVKHCTLFWAHLKLLRI